MTTEDNHEKIPTADLVEEDAGAVTDQTEEQTPPETVPPDSTVEKRDNVPASEGSDRGTVSREDMVNYLRDHDILVKALRKKLGNVLHDPEFLLDESRVERASKGLEKPNLDDRLKASARTNAKKELRNKAFEDAERTGKPVVPPTEKEIQDKVDEKLQERENELLKKREEKIAKVKAAILAERQSVS